MRLKKEHISRKMALMVGLLLWVLVVRLLVGCSVEKEHQDKVKDLDFTVVTEEEMPEELKQIIDEKKPAAFKMTYSDDKGLYIVVGYGEQKTGGYSIGVQELYLTDNSIVFDTELTGPGKDEAKGVEKSYPFIVVMTEYLEEPVVFQ